MENSWNPWHGCRKISPGCRNCYVYRIDAMHGRDENSSLCHKTAAFDLPVKRARDGNYKIPSGTTLYTCFTSDFLLEDADEWRPEAWKMMKERSDLHFFFFTKRIDRMKDCLPPDWGNGYGNVTVGCTVENQQMADHRLPIFLSLPLKHRVIGVEPILESVDLTAYLDGIGEVSVGGESGENVRESDYGWVLDIRRQCVEKNVPFFYHQTGSYLRKDGKLYIIPRRLQGIQARKAQIDFRPKND
ncbi:MAG: DUF5131 family protein [Firmicutes bacterium]|nr:DUF5131 family protein [Candidatus Colimorpha enterica]